MDPHDRPPRRAEEPTGRPTHRPAPHGGPPQPVPFDQQNTLQAPQFTRPTPPPPPGQAPPPAPGVAGPPAAAPPAAPHPSAAPAGWPQGPAATQPSAPRALPAPPTAGRRWWLIGAAVAVAAAVLVAVVVLRAGTGQSGAPAQTTAAAPTSRAQVPGASTTPPSPTAAPAPPPAGPPPPPPAPVVGPDALAPLLLTDAELSTQLGTPGFTSVGVENQMLGGASDPPHCTGAWGPAYATSYGGTGYTGVAVSAASVEKVYKVGQAVVSFPDPAAAKAAYDSLVAGWNRCASTHLMHTEGAATGIDVGTPRPDGDVMTLLLIPTTSATPGQQCERDMTLRGNVIVDVRSCSTTAAGGGVAITRAIADKIR